MITREEAKAKIWDNKSINTLSKVESSKVIDELFDQFESQSSSNPLQLTCESCKNFFQRFNEEGYLKYNVCDKGINACYDKFYCSYHTTKDTK